MQAPVEYRLHVGKMRLGSLQKPQLQGFYLHALSLAALIEAAPRTNNSLKIFFLLTQNGTFI